MSNASYPGSSRNSRGQPQNRNGSFHQADTSNWGGNHPHPLHQARPGQYPPSSYTGNRAAYQNRGSLPTPIRGMGEVFPSPHQRYRSNGGYVLDRSQYQSRGAPPVQTRNRDEWFNLDTHQAYDGYRSGHRQPVQPQSASTASSNSRDRFHSPKFAGPPDRWQANTHTQTIARANPHVRRDSGSESIALRSSSPSNHLSSEERKMKDLIRVLETQAALTRRDSEGEFSSSIFWTEDHSQSFSRVLEQMDRVDNPESRQMAIKTLILAFHRMMACKSASRFEANERARIGDLKEGLVNRVYDMCEDGDEQVRKAGYLAMKDLSECDRTLLKRNADILVQLLQHEDPTEHELIATALLEHVRQSPLDSFDVIVQDHCREELRPLALSFLASPQSEVVLQDVVVGITANEAGLAERLSEVIPLADQEELELLAILLRPLETLWLPPFDFATTEEWETTARAARKVITALLEVTLKQLGGDSESRGDILDPEKMPDMQPVLPFFQALLNHLCSKSTSASITDQQGVKLVNFVAEQEGALKLAEILLGSYSHPGDANRPLSWMKPKPSAWVGQILANSMARLSVILDDPTVRTSLTNEQLNAFDQTSKRLAEGTIQSLIVGLIKSVQFQHMQIRLFG
ncbi:hypothetical protein IE53DRAFT_20566 [Violaceomyces palustris]|uniref:Uncharacterized protein n=1 Tax=Violaceomyces palustris TaxID=1673888 RepID=A0ACD0P1N9_9BASI|nr:hypothetical protein IE53DRAFT_20566 [Violaceomyces palustris]